MAKNKWKKLYWYNNRAQHIYRCSPYCEHRIPSGSTILATWSASELAKSVLAGVTARIRHVSFEMNISNMSLICCSISAGWSPTGTFVSPGRSISVMFKTGGKKKRFRQNGGKSKATAPIMAVNSNQRRGSQIWDTTPEFLKWCKLYFPQWKESKTTQTVLPDFANQYLTQVPSEITLRMFLVALELRNSRMGSIIFTC